MNDQRHDISLAGVIRLTSPLHVTAFTTGGKGARPLGAPVETMTMGLARWYFVPRRGAATETAPKAAETPTTLEFIDDAAEPDAPDDAQGYYRQVRIPFVPGNSIRGRLRRSAADLLERRAIESGAQYSPALFRLSRVGSTSAAGAKDAYDLDVHQQVYDNVFLGIFGAETDYRSRLVTSDLVPVTQDTVDLKMVPESAVADRANMPPPMSGRRALIDTTTMAKRDDFKRLDDPMAPEVIRDYRNQYDEWTQSFLRARSDSAAKKMDFDNIFSFEVVPAGTRLYFNINAQSLLPSQIGFLLLAIEDMAHTRPLGGMGRQGFGRWFADALSLTVDGAPTPGAIALGSDQATQWNDRAEVFVTAAKKALQDLDIGEMDDLARRFETAAVDAKSKRDAAKPVKKAKTSA